MRKIRIPLIIALILSTNNYLTSQTKIDSLKLLDQKIVSFFLEFNECKNVNGDGTAILSKTKTDLNGLATAFTFGVITEDFQLIGGPYEIGFTYHADLTRDESGNLKTVNATRRCNQNSQELIIEDNLIRYFKQGNNYYKIILNEKGEISKIDEESYSKYGNEWKGHYYIIEHNEKGQLYRVAIVNSVAKGKIRSEIQEFYNYPTRENIYLVYTENYDSIKTIQYKSKKGKNANLELAGSSYRSITKNGNLIIYKCYDNSKRWFKTVISEYNDDMVKKVTYYFDNMIRVCDFFYTKDGRLEKEIEKQFNKDNSFLSHHELYYTYSLTDGKSPDDACSYTYDSTSKDFDYKGVCIREFKGGMMRVRLENGEWGPWKTLQY